MNKNHKKVSDIDPTKFFVITEGRYNFYQQL